MQTNSESIYFRDISRYKILTDVEERELVKDVQIGNKVAADKLVNCNLRFVVSVARRYRGRGLSYLELINEGNLGLLKAAKRFDIEKKVKFISYAVWWIRQSIQKAIFEQAGTVRIPLNKIALVNRFKKALDTNKGNYNKTIMMDEFRKYEQEIVDVMEKTRGISLETPIANDNNSEDTAKTLQDVLGEPPNQDEESERRELSSMLENVMQNITSREERILRMYYGLNFSRQFTLEEIGTELSLTRERVRLIRDRSLRKLFKNQIARDKLFPFVNRRNED
jgi:RNA polymerase primary sigma factor